MGISDILKTVDLFGKKAGQERKSSPQIIQKTKAVRFPQSSAGTIFEVQSAATGNGVYNCYEQTLDSTDWIDIEGADKFDDKNTTTVEVFNLLENDPVSDYTPALGLYDRIMAWKKTDDEGNSRWVGIPLTNSDRRVRAKEAAGSSNHITCNLMLNNNNEATSGQLGYGIEVYGHICNGSALNSASPRIANGEGLDAYNEQGKWWFTTTFQTTEPCDCYTA